MKLAPAFLLLTLVAGFAAAAPDAHFDGARYTVTNDAVLGSGTNGSRHSLGLTVDPKTHAASSTNVPSAGNEQPSGLAAYKGGLMAAGAGGAMGALLAFGLGFSPVGIVGLTLLGAGAGLGLFGGSHMEKVAGGAAVGAGIGLAAAVALGATPFGWPMLALAAFGAAAAGGLVHFFGK